MGLRKAATAGPHAGLEIRAAGERGLLVEVTGSATAAALHAYLHAHPLPGQAELVPAARTVLLRLATAAQARQAAGLLAELAPGSLSEAASEPGLLVELDTVYNGEDLDEVAQLTGLGSAAAVAEAHSAAVWTAAFSGFAPGFAYLTGSDPRLDVPRRAEPRTAVPAGAVALAGGYSAAYPGTSPGGWQLIGWTAAPLWDLEREAPALIVPGTRVKFRPVRERVDVGSGGENPAPPPEPGAHSREAREARVPRPEPDSEAAGNAAAAVVLAPGPLATVQDAGRPGYSQVGVGRSGAADRAALARANRMVGNPPGAAGIEVLFGGLRFRAARDLALAVTGASVPLAVGSADGTERLVPPNTPVLLRSGEVLSLGAPDSGLRSYVAFRGGIAAQPVLGSRSTDTLAGLGPKPLAPGTELRLGPEPRAAVGVPEVPPPLPGAAAELRYTPGPRQDWFSGDGIDAFTSMTWTVETQSNRVGLRFGGDPLPGRRAGELESEAVLPGSIQVPPSGLPILFLADAPVTGGYPVIGVVVEADLDTAAQLRPGTTVRFVPVPPRR